MAVAIKKRIPRPVARRNQFGFWCRGDDTIAKLFFYYLHERAWYKFSDFGIEKKKRK